MSDERTIYISPEDDLTTVRERLEQLQSKRVTLVIPVQTQLRSHVAWKLLYARTRELGKEVLIVSSDPQVRSVAHAVKFKVAHSLNRLQLERRAQPVARCAVAAVARASHQVQPHLILRWEKPFLLRVEKLIFLLNRPTLQRAEKICLITVARLAMSQHHRHFIQSEISTNPMIST